MVREDKLKPLLLEHDGPLDQLGHDLIAAANAAGGRDNITVILFTLEEVDAPARAGGGADRGAALVDEDTREYNTFQGEAVAEPRQGVSRPQGHTRRCDEARRRAGATARQRRGRGRVPRLGTVALSAVRPRAQPIEEGHAARATRPAAAAPRRRRLLSPGKLIAVSCIIGLLAAFWLATRQVFFVGVDESRGNVVTLYKGLPYDLPLGIRLYSPVRHSGVTLQSVPGRAPRDLHEPQAALQGRRRGPRAGGRRGTHLTNERAQPRAAGADPGVAAADGRVRRDLHPALRRSSRTSR